MHLNDVNNAGSCQMFSHLFKHVRFQGIKCSQTYEGFGLYVKRNARQTHWYARIEDSPIICLPDSATQMLMGEGVVTSVSIVNRYRI
jgi:hypothetical protein